MTSFMIDAHKDRPQAPSWKGDDGCPFCKIIAHSSPAYRLYENDRVAAFLDILPLRAGHTLVVPKIHCARVSELPEEYAAALGAAVSKIANALTKAVDHTGLNVVCNQEYAQAVHHVHYHIIPAPRLNAPSTTKAIMPESTIALHQREFEARDDLDEDEAEELIKKIQAHL
ncbi:HIT-like protein [Peniophora sp. CONT]|nr:HIT-like protein [Peniophora sp. CONT]